MASIGYKKTAAGTRYYIQLSPGEREGRPKIHLGAANLRQAETAKVNIEALLAGSPLPKSVQEWLSTIRDESVIKRLETLGLIEPKDDQWMLSAWTADYIAKRPDVKETTRRKWKDVQSKLDIFFKGDLLGDITTQQAKNFQTYLKSTVKLGDNTLRRHIGITRQFFNAAVDAEIITRNPFKSKALPVSVKANESKFFFVTPEIAQKALEACPDNQWRLIFGLARYGGLRCPSEVLRLKWVDIDWARRRFTVYSPKTEHHPGQDKRVVPIFPELMPLFQAAFDDAEPGAVYCIDKYEGKWSNVGVHMRRILENAKIKPWPKLFQNCRSTRETELFKSTGGNVKAVCSWLGNSPVVAMAHYAQVTEADMKLAAENTVLEKQEKGAENGGYNQYHPASEEAGKCPQDDLEKNDISPCDNSDLQQFAETCSMSQNEGDWAVQDLNL